MSRIFISRTGADKEIAQWIAATLQTAGHTVDIQDLNFLPGENRIQREMDALDRADHVIAVFSPGYFQSQNCRNELSAATAGERSVIPVVVERFQIPVRFQYLIFIDFVGKDESTRRAELLRATGISQPRTLRTFISKLPRADPTLIGREPELAFLDECWGNADTNLVQIIAPGGTGKTALMTKWYRQHLKDTTIFGWSFYSQGTNENHQTSSDPFFAEVLPFFSIKVPETASIYTKAELLARHLRDEKVLLILDGIEPLQDSSGALRDTALKALLEELAASNREMVLCTTRLRLTDLPDDEPGTRSRDLENLDPIHGAEYLRHLGVKGEDDELRKASEHYRNHAFSLTLLGTYLVDYCDADVRRRIEIATLPGADQMVAAYARMYTAKPELDVLQALGYFNRPPEPEALRLVLPAMPNHQYRAALKSLHKARLILTRDPKEPIDCHPLVREYFATTATTEGHSRLYEHYCQQAPYQPDTLEEMTPLFYAVYHGCRAGQHQQALEDVYVERIDRGDEYYLVNKLGAFGTDLSLLANFFQTPWTEPVPTLTLTDQSWLVGQAAFALVALGRLDEAAQPMLAAANAAVKHEDWDAAASAYNSQSQLLLTLGYVTEAIAIARNAMEFADLSGDSLHRMRRRTTLANALHQSGEIIESARLFDKLVRTRGVILDGLSGYQYCDLLLSQGKTAEAMRRASVSLGRSQRPLSLGLHHLSLGHLDEAVEFLRRAGAVQFLPLALLARGTDRDLEEVYKLATRCGMRLHLADYHLAKGNCQQAEALINETGYHRRDASLKKCYQAASQSKAST